MRPLKILLLSLFLCATLHAHAQTPQSVSLCDVEANPVEFNHKLLLLTGTVSREFEDFTLVDHCPESPQGVWLMFGGDANDDVTYCCSNHNKAPGHDLTVEGIRIPIRKDRALEQFNLLTSTRLVSGIPESYPLEGSDTPYYTVTARFLGTFFAGEREQLPNGKTRYGGYGHLGCCSLFVIQQVMNIDSAKSNAGPGDRECHAYELSWHQTENQSAGSPERVASELVRKKQSELHDEAKGSLVGVCSRDSIANREVSRDKMQLAQCKWRSKSDPDYYVIQLVKHGPLHADAAFWTKTPWKIAWGYRYSCAAAQRHSGGYAAPEKF
jgi:hypothetical protein